MCASRPKTPNIPPPLPMPPAPRQPPAPAMTNRAPEPIGNPNQNIGIDTQQSKTDKAGTTPQGTNQLKIKLNTGTRYNNSGINI